MDFQLGEEQEALQRSVRQVLAERCPASLVRRVVESGVPAEEPWRSARELGWTALALPEPLGASGLGFEELGLVIEEHGRALAPGPFLATTSQFAPLLREAGSAVQRERFLSPLAAGGLTGALAFTGRRGGLRADDELRARRAGAGWRLDGCRSFVLDGGSADEIAVAARVEPGDGVGLFCVPRWAVELQPLVSLDPSRRLATLGFEAVEVPPERVLGEPGRGAEPLARALDEATVALALETVGTCQALLEICLAHARQRFQFERAIGTFQAVQHKCADMFVQVEKARATAYFAMMTIAEDDPRRRLAASLAKAAAGDCQALVCREAIQIHGGIGFTWECDVQLYVKRAQTGGALLGSAHQHRARIASLVLDEAQQGRRSRPRSEP